jgi:hypothetical protein
MGGPGSGRKKGSGNSKKKKLMLHDGRSQATKIRARKRRLSGEGMAFKEDR